MRVLVTGGAGYLGSHAAVALLAAGHDVAVVDDLSNARADAACRIERIAGRGVAFHAFDLRDEARLSALFADAGFDAVMHFAGLKAVGDSVRDPLTYYDTNVGATTSLLRAMNRTGVCTLVFSSSAAIYGDGAVSPVREDSPTAPSSPYGWTKAVIEQMLRDLADADDRWRIGILRYFNPVGAHPSGCIGDDPLGTASNLVPRLAQVALGQAPYLPIFGADYPTPDGTGLRDYIHVQDLVAGHLAALGALGNEGWRVREWNLGTGRPVSVLEMLQAFAAVVGRDLPYRIFARRPGDVATMFADPARSSAELGWSTTLSLTDMCVDAWRWHAGDHRPASRRE